jgi:hypothetical protein
MRSVEFINEGMNFSASKFVNIDGKQYISDEAPGLGEYKKLTCWYCNGTGTDYHPDTPCPICKGERTKEQWVSAGPTLSVSNSNGMAIQGMLGIPEDQQDYGGVIPHEKLPELIRHLIKIKNKSLAGYTEPSSVEQGKMKKYTDPETGLSSIGRSATMIYGGRSVEQVERYVDKLLELAKFAQQNGAMISWG